MRSILRFRTPVPAIVKVKGVCNLWREEGAWDSGGRGRGQRKDRRDRCEKAGRMGTVDLRGMVVRGPWLYVHFRAPFGGEVRLWLRLRAGRRLWRRIRPRLCSLVRRRPCAWQFHIGRAVKIGNVERVEPFFYFIHNMRGLFAVARGEDGAQGPFAVRHGALGRRGGADIFRPARRRGNLHVIAGEQEHQHRAIKPDMGADLCAVRVEYRAGKALPCAGMGDVAQQHHAFALTCFACRVKVGVFDPQPPHTHPADADLFGGILEGPAMAERIEKSRAPCDGPSVAALAAGPQRREQSGFGAGRIVAGGIGAERIRVGRIRAVPGHEAEIDGDVRL